MPLSKGRKLIQVRDYQHKELKLMATYQGITMAELFTRILEQYKATATELHHPIGDTPVPLVYQQKESK